MGEGVLRLIEEQGKLTVQYWFKQSFLFPHSVIQVYMLCLDILIYCQKYMSIHEHFNCRATIQKLRHETVG